MIEKVAKRKVMIAPMHELLKLTKGSKEMAEVEHLKCSNIPP
jgi:hypothetical protein